ncbi:related to extragenic suppressor of kinetochore protein 1 [Rhynchosporium graminicola]|uniref:Related to extragenic suppressor of kinetochore protein 1 n=1 Tax=Rhynchosporium graminicola TaxID=2792576 RepID=A0A1E1KE89_9HELO|nr:related to extragenic suppressor of kinetochore protein 1 [Rhynchosporium commune]
MFWRFGGYANISAIDTILDRQEFTLEELLDESDLIQELKQHNTKLIEFLREDKILERLLEYVVTPKLEPVVVEVNEATAEKEEDAELKGKDRSFSQTRGPAEDDEDEKEKKRNRYAYVSAEVLSSDNWSICESLIENEPLLRKFWDFLKLPPPLDPLQASYFTKVNEALLDKKTEEMLDLFKSLDGAVKNMLQHVDSPMVMDLLLKIISLEKAEGGQGIVDWLHSQDLMPILLSFLSSEHSWATQTSAGDFLKAIITISANASQNEQSCIGPNELTRQLVSQPCIEKLISDMLKGGNPLTVGVGIVIEVIRKNNSDYDPDVGAEANAVPSSRDPIYLGTLLRMFAQRVPDFMELILSPNHTIGGGDGPVTIRRKELSAAFGGKIEPLGFDRFKTCELMAELLHCSNMGLLNEVGSEEFIKHRDTEREKLKAEGKLSVSSDQAGNSNDDLTMKSSTQTRLGSPDGSRKLEVQNASDDEGFEEVTHASDLGDDAKDDFDEKPESEEDLLNHPILPAISFMPKDDEEFVDEPLTSPHLKFTEDHHLEQPELAVMPLSPTREISQQVEILDIKEDIHMPSPPPSIDTATEGSDGSASDSKHSPESSEESADSPKEDEDPSARVVQAGGVPAPASLETVAHPEDKPAPLFAKKVEPVQELVLPPVPEVAQSTGCLDTTMGEAGDSSNSIMMTNTDEHNQQALEESQSSPVVGDFLKMQFVEHKVVPTILDFFFRFPWNNFLHNVVYDVVQQVFNGPMDRGFNRSLAIDLFETGNITMRIVDGQKKSDETQEKSKMRLGYMGHLTLIAEEVVKFTERHPPELLSDSVLDKVMNGEWVTYVEVTLAETRERDNAILGGVRPDTSVGPRQAVMNAVNAATNFSGTSSALADAGLNGAIGLDSIDLANGNGTSAFTLSGGTLSGFGSSSDEEDDEMDEDNDEDGTRNNSGAAEVGHSVPPAPNLDKFDDEEVDYEYLEQLDCENPLFSEGTFSRYISTPSTTTATSSDLEPPSLPPPPPPLALPSRARRQLAARLALHSKQNEQSAISPTGDERAEEAEHQKNLNPFAAEEDDDEDSDNDADFSIGDLDGEDESLGIVGTGRAGFSSEERQLRKLAREGRGKNVGIPSFDDFNCTSISNNTDGGHGLSNENGNSNSSLPVLLQHPIILPPAPRSPLNLGIGRASFPSLWPFHNSSTSNSKGSGSSSGSGSPSSPPISSESHFRGHVHRYRSKNSANEDDVQSDDDDDDDDIDIDSDDSDGGYGHALASRSSFGDEEGEGEGIQVGVERGNRRRSPRRRMSVTTEAKRRTSLEDDDDDEGEDEVVHVKMAETEVEDAHRGAKTDIQLPNAAAVGGSDDGELVEIQHSETLDVDIEGGK